jgi:hypothetical protein
VGRFAKDGRKKGKGKSEKQVLGCAKDDRKKGKSKSKKLEAGPRLRQG